MQTKLFIDYDKLSGREKVLYNSLNDGEFFWPISQWPQWAQFNQLCSHRDRNQRYNLFFFLVGNGLSPELASDWCLATHYNASTKKWVSFGPNAYDRDAHIDQAGMIEKYYDREKKDPFFKQTKWMLDMTINKIVPF